MESSQKLRQLQKGGCVLARCRTSPWGDLQFFCTEERGAKGNVTEMTKSDEARAGGECR